MYLLIKKKQLNPATAALLKNASYHQIWTDIELRKPNPKLKLDTMNDRHVSNLPLHATTVLANLPLHANLPQIFFFSSSVLQSPIAEAELLRFSYAVQVFLYLSLCLLFLF
jgi:hypothetical protein